MYNVPRTYSQALPLIPFSIPVIENHVQVAIRACIDCLGQWFLNFFESGTGRWFMMLFADHLLEMLNFSWQYRIKYENEEIEAWFEGVIIGVWRNSWMKPDDDATRPACSGRYGIQRWVGTVAGATSCLTTNAFTLKLVKPCSPIFLVAMAVFFWPIRGKAEYHSLTCHWGPCRYRWLKPNVW